MFEIVFDKIHYLVNIINDFRIDLVQKFKNQFTQSSLLTSNSSSNDFITTYPDNYNIPSNIELMAIKSNNQTIRPIL